MAEAISRVLLKKRLTIAGNAEDLVQRTVIFNQLYPPDYEGAVPYDEYFFYFTIQDIPQFDRNIWTQFTNWKICFISRKRTNSIFF